ncbi:MAG: hypothetical protein LBS19_00515 [Clostridiales bacterium]|jgi:hypothetical protein|nr:hypothetical protein [Clostridiales bacterium]
MATEIEIRRNDRDYLYQMLVAQYRSKTPSDFKDLISQTKAKMEAEDVKLVLQAFEEWKNN